MITRRSPLSPALGPLGEVLDAIAPAFNHQLHRPMNQPMTLIAFADELVEILLLGGSEKFEPEIVENQQRHREHNPPTRQS